MSWFSSFRGVDTVLTHRSGGLRPLAFGTMLLAAGALMGACSFQPVYSGTLASQPTLDLAYAKPTTRLEQIIYQDLALRLGSSAAATASLASVSVATGSGGNSVRSVSDGATDFAQTAVTATLTITPRGPAAGTPQTITRTATAQYTTTGQVLADNAAATDASERAAKAVAESLRLGVLAAFSR